MKTRLLRVDEAKLLRKIDRRVTLVSRLPRSVSLHHHSIPTQWVETTCRRINVSNAVVLGLREDLKLKGAEFNTALVVL